MLFFQDEKDKLKQELAIINNKLEDALGTLGYHRELLAELRVRLDDLIDPPSVSSFYYGARKDGTPRAEGITLTMNSYPHGAKKDGTPRAKPGRKPREQR